jgi:hypothetical protein
VFSSLKLYMHPLAKNASACLGRLMGQASFVRVISEAQPYFALFPG